MSIASRAWFGITNAPKIASLEFEMKGELHQGRVVTVLTLVSITFIALAPRLTPVVLAWSAPWAAHHPDEVVLPFEAIAQWEGIVPRELGWPASTTRLALSMAYGIDMLVDRTSLLVTADSAPEAMELISSWSAEKIDAPERLFFIGRLYSVLVGVLAVHAAFWAATQWVGRRAAVVAAMLTAISPLAVSYSQLVLADMTGVLFVTGALGLWSHPLRGYRAAAATGVLIGLAVASKYHFAIWLVPALVWIASSTALPRVRSASLLLGSSALTYLTLVPWVWLNPTLVVKEFLHVVVTKVTPRSDVFWPFGPFANLHVGIHHLGWLASFGVVLGIVYTVSSRNRRWLPVQIALTMGILVIASARIMHARYGLLLLPAIAICAAAGYSGLLESPSRTWRLAGYLMLILITLLTCGQLVLDQMQASIAPPSLQAAQWLRSEAKPRQRIAVYSIFEQPLPRTREQLRNLIAEREGEQAYLQKMASNHYVLSRTSQPFRATVLCDESSASYWFSRELSIRRDGEGFEVFHYDDVPKFGSLDAEKARALFLDGPQDDALGFDFFLTAHPFAGSVNPAEVFSAPGRQTLYLYVR